MGTQRSISDASVITTLPGRAITKTSTGDNAVRRIAALMRVRGYAVKSRLPYNSPYDLLCNGKRVEVKTAEYRHLEANVWGWQVNIHRHGRVDESQVDVYVIELRADFLGNSIILIKPSPIGVATPCWYPYGLLKGKHAQHVDNWQLLEPVAPNPTLPELLK